MAFEFDILKSTQMRHSALKRLTQMAGSSQLQWSCENHYFHTSFRTVVSSLSAAFGGEKKTTTSYNSSIKNKTKQKTLNQCAPGGDDAADVTHNHK